MRTKEAGIIANLQALRAVAAFAVACFHLRIVLPAAAEPALYAGNAGVDIFFVISGFIISFVAGREDKGHPGWFLAKRALRVVPLYWLLTLVAFALIQAKPALAGNGGVPSAGALLHSLLFIPYRDATGEMHPVVFVGWTLNYEMAFYLVFAAAMLVRAALTRALLVSAVMIAAVLAGLAYPGADPLIKTYTDPLLLEFVAGIWLSFAFPRMPGALGIPVRLALVGAIVLAAVGLVAATVTTPDAPRILLWGLPAILIVGAALMLERSGATARSTGVLMLGAASYAVYLVHTFVIKILSVGLGRHLAGWSLPMRVGLLAGGLVAIALVGIGVHLLVEVPLTRALRRWLLPAGARRHAVGVTDREAALVDPTGASA